MAELYGSAETYYSAGGSTLCIQAMLAAMKLEGRKVIAARNSHRAFLNAAALLDIDTEWLMPEYSGGILSGEISLEKAEAMLIKNPNSCLYITSPDYTGKTADISALAEICHRYGAVLLVDNAHGAHLAFMEKNIHPIALGADICCDSAHKMLPALTGAAMLHTSAPKYSGILRQCMSMFGSTSPSYIIMASLDLCCDYIETRIRSDIKQGTENIKKYCREFSGSLRFAEGDPFHITIMAAESGYDGIELAENMRRSGAECEYADHELIVLLMSPCCDENDYHRLSEITCKALSVTPKRRTERRTFSPVLPERVCSIRQAFFAESEEIPVEEAEGRICASVKVPCPPAVPIAVSGEKIDSRCINIYKSYGISTVIVVK